MKFLYNKFPVLNRWYNSSIITDCWPSYSAEITICTASKDRDFGARGLNLGEFIFCQIWIVAYNDKGSLTRSTLTTFYSQTRLPLRVFHTEKLPVPILSVGSWFWYFNLELVVLRTKPPLYYIFYRVS